MDLERDQYFLLEQVLYARPPMDVVAFSHRDFRSIGFYRDKSHRIVCRSFAGSDSAFLSGSRGRTWLLYKSHKSLLGFSETCLIHRTLADNHPNILNWAAPVCSLVLPLELNALGFLGNFSMRFARWLGNIPPNRREMLNRERLPQTRQ